MKAYIVKIELEDTKPLVWRRVVLPAGATFKRLHDVIQNSTNFKSGYPYGDYHLYRFELTKENIVVTNDEEEYENHKHYMKNKSFYEERLKTMPEEMLQFEIPYQKSLESKVYKPSGLKIDDYLEKHKSVRYNYDFGDDWWFTIKLEKTVDDYSLGYPTLLDGKESAPPEDVGGVFGFYEFLEEYHNSKSLEHISTRNWAEGMDFREYDKDLINGRLKKIKYKK